MGSARQFDVDPAAGAVVLDAASTAQLSGPLAESRSVPTPACQPAPRLIPSSCTEICEYSRPSRSASRRPPDALECRTALVSASVTIRYAATSTASGQLGSGVGASDADLPTVQHPHASPARQPARAAPQQVQGCPAPVAGGHRPIGGCLQRAGQHCHAAGPADPRSGRCHWTRRRSAALGVEGRRQ